MWNPAPGVACFAGEVDRLPTSLTDGLLLCRQAWTMFADSILMERSNAGEGTGMDRR